MMTHFFIAVQVFDEVEVLQKVMHTVSLTKASEISFGKFKLISHISVH